MENIIEISKSLENPGLLTVSATEEVKHEIRKRIK